jgi:ATP-dependent helicase/nuclease subunit A
VHAQQLLKRAKNVLEGANLQRYFDSTQWTAAWNELDIVSKEGRSYRIDRLVEFEDHLAILDYKLSIPPIGSEMFEKYQAQLKTYQAELSRIRKDKPNKAYLISAEGTIQEIA